ncbi:MAG: Threonine--tRNA ligase [Alphaproteobacteria bacterium MarineAlpha5_Bin12]|nr:threonine--tRNA ligase [Pelagibacteraceae bacterium]PPR41226.1 MAG: Threonine--tRNA ligase [Alphaproteobacteria bacterium MarineAlpha5_Bin12]|tara:strand:- start:8022 stop:9932 length:1911 start_codon:yes stop_codon:yes gene_type:complete
MINITLPDGSIKKYSEVVSGLKIAESISQSLAKNSLVIKINNKLQDLSINIDYDCSVEIITKKSPEALDIIRHDAAHVMAEAVQEIFPKTKVAIGPTIKDGFYYDFDSDVSFSPDDFKKIEKKMSQIIKRNNKFVREIWDRKKALKFFEDKNEIYKVEIIKSLNEDEDLTIYKQGEWVDLCRGPHSISTGFINYSFKIMKIAGAYWRGNSKNKMLQRIYATAWIKENDLIDYINRITEAEKRDHRKLGNELELFHIQEESIGNIFWHPKGWTLYRICQEYMRKKLNQSNYKEVRTPSLIDKRLWEESGHWEKFRENMFITQGEDEKPMALKPMNCPAHVQIFKQGIKSYRDLPYRMSEFGSCHRNEPSGSLHGLMRVRGFTQDDAHIFCTKDQINSETESFCKLLTEIYNDFGFTKINIRFADRPEKRAGDDSTWDQAENALENAIKAIDLPYQKDPGGGAFYGPKLDFVLTDTLGREWQCGTLQVDFVLPERLDASYIDERGSKVRPVMLHRAILGSMERFIGVLMESTGGKFPLWLAPIQIMITNISEESIEYAKKIHEICINRNLRAEIDIRNEQLNYKIREHSNKKIPIILVVGRNEMKDQNVSIRRLGSEKQEIVTLKKAIDEIENASYMP